MAENSDINIRLNIKPGEDDAGQFVDKAVSDVGKDAKESSEQAERLLKMITEIVSRLNGLDSGAAKALKKDLLDISSILGKLDSAPLKSIGNTISEIAKKKDSLTDGDMSSFSESIRVAAKEASVEVRLDAASSLDGEVQNRIENIGEEAERSSDHAARLLTVIAELIDKLNGMDSEAAKKLRDDLQQLAEVVNTLDTARLEHLDSILESLTATGKKVADQTGDVSKKIKQVTDEAQKFKDSFSNDAGVKVNVTFDAADSMEDLRQKIDITEEANDLIANLKNIRRELSNLEEGGFRNLDKVSKPLEDIIEQFKNLDSKNVQKGAESFERLTKAIASLSEKDRGMLKSFDFSKLDRQVSGITDKIKSTTKETDKVGFIADLLQGKFDAVGNRILDLIQKTKAWASATSKVGVAKAGAALAVFTAGIATMGKVAQAYIERIIAEKKELLAAVRDNAMQTAKTARDNWEYGNRERERASKQAEIERDSNLAKVVGYADMEKSARDANRQRALVSETDPAERERINREADREIADIDYSVEVQKINAAEDKLNRQISDKEKSIEKFREVLKAFDGANSSVGMQLTELTSGGDGYWAEAVNMITKKFGFGSADEIAKSQDAMDELMDMRRKAAEELKDLELSLKETKAQRITTVDNARASLQQDRATELAKRDAEDAERRRGYDISNARRGRELSERSRMETEANEEADRAYEDTMRDFAGRQKALKDLLDKRIAERAAKQKELDELLKKNAGIEEQNWSEWDKQRRDWLESDVQRLNGTVRSLQTEARNAQRAGDTEGVQFARGRREERREREEADRALLNQWRERMGGPAATASVAYDEAQTRKAQLAESTKRQNDLIESVRQRLIAEKRIGANEKVDFENLKYNKLMTDAEREAYDNNRSDIRRDTANVKTAASRVAEVEADRADRFAEFRDNAMKQSNRLTAMGLGGGAVVGDFGRATADNTRRANELLKDILGALKADGGTESGKKLMDSLSSWSM